MNQTKELKKEKVGQEVGTPVQKIRTDIKALWAKVSYKSFLANMPYVSFIALLTVIYIGNNHRAVEIQRELGKQQKVLKELRWRDMDTKTRLMNARMETKIIRTAEPLGLKPLTLPAYSIQVAKQ